MSHPFGDLLSQHLHRQHGLSQAKLAAGISQEPSIISGMCKGQRLTGPQARERVLAILRWLREQGVLQTVAEANALLNAAGMASLHGRAPAEALLLQQLGRSVALPPRVPRQRTNLPAPLTSFIGRERELAEVRHLMAEHRLVTLTGAGGVGKTRLAVEVGMSLAEVDSTDLADGVWLVEFAPLADATLVPQLITHVFGLFDTGGRAPLDLLQDYLTDKRLLLILDNCEHLIQACAQVTEWLLQYCWHVRVLATSRESLRVPGERTYLVPSLDTPESSEVSVARLLECASARLFVERVRAARPQFAVQPDNVAPLAQICNHLNGVPLALELAAARVRAFTVEQIAARLDDAFRLLTGGSRTALPRQQTLRATLDWSYGLLPEEERALLRELSVFAGGWTLEAAEAVDGADPAGQLDQLVNKSLVATEETPAGMRYQMLETVRQYAHEKLVSAGEHERAHGRHLAYFCALAEEAEPRLSGAEGDRWLARLATELDNLRAAIDWASANGEAAAGLRLVLALDSFWDKRGHLHERRERVLKALAGLDPRERSLMRAKVLNRAAYVQWYHQGHSCDDEVRALLEEALAIGTELGERASVAQTLQYLSYLAFSQKDFAAARVLNGKALALWWELGNPSMAALALGEKAELTRWQGDLDQAQHDYEEAIAQFTALDDRYWGAAANRRLGRVMLQRGDYEKAVALCRRSLALGLESGHKQETVACLATFAGLAVAVGQSRRAARLLGAVEAMLYQLDLPLFYGDLYDYEDNLSALRAQLDGAILDAAWAEGQVMTLEQAVAYALREGEAE
jgi:predicted ATPase